MTVEGNHLMVRDESSNNPHLVKIVNGEKKALCNARYRVWEADTVATHSETGVWENYKCARCEKKAHLALRDSDVI